MTESARNQLPGPSPFRILTVCTGNICRSPMAERLLQSGFNQRAPGSFIVESAGTRALVGSPIDQQIANSIRALGGRTEDFSARQLTTNILQQHDLVIALSREHRSSIVQLAPSMLKKTFTLREIARLLPSIKPSGHSLDADRWRAMLPQAIRARSAQTGRPEDDDVVDPYRKNEATYGLMMREMLPALQRVVEW